MCPEREWWIRPVARYPLPVTRQERDQAHPQSQPPPSPLRGTPPVFDGGRRRSKRPPPCPRHGGEGAAVLAVTEGAATHSWVLPCDGGVVAERWVAGGGSYRRPPSPASPPSLRPSGLSPPVDTGGERPGTPPSSTEGDVFQAVLLPIPTQRRPSPPCLRHGGGTAALGGDGGRRRCLAWRRGRLRQRAVRRG